MVNFKNLMNKFVVNQKFKKAGEGRRLDSMSAAESVNKLEDTADNAGSALPSEAAKLAAINRIQKSKKPETINRSADAIRRRAREELAKEMTLTATTIARDNINHQDEEDDDKLFFECKELFPDLVLPKKMLLDKIKNELTEELSENPLIAACLLFRTFNIDNERVDKAINLFCKYLMNIKDHPDELQKYGRIRVENKVYQQAFAQMNYVEVVMNAIGFNRTQQEDNGEYVYNFEADHSDIDMSVDVLMSTVRVEIKLSRDLKVFKADNKDIDKDIPDSFYDFSAQDVRRRYDQVRVKTDEILMTKQMREKLKEQSRAYNFCFVRVKFPDGLLLQGTFRATENVSDIVSFVKGSLINDNHTFTLTCTGTDHKMIINSSEQNLNVVRNIRSLGICPAVLFYFHSQNLKDNFLNDQCMNMLSDLA
ncbi:hypothetical protein GJ496_000596 [Pomphorhynchus laevis]|nr:hypothetical protein GJ496_000596 [Pomphorhynchus laevis]